MSIIESLSILVRRINLYSMHFLSRLETPKHVHNKQIKEYICKYKKKHAHARTDTHQIRVLMYIQSNSRARSIELLLARILSHFSFHFFPFLFFYRFRFNFFFFFYMCYRVDVSQISQKSTISAPFLFFFFFLFFISFFCSWLHTTFVPFVHPITNSQLVPLRDGPNAQKTRPRRKKRERTERFRSGVIEVSIQ